MAQLSRVELIRKLYELHLEQEEWIDSLPTDIRDAFFDNAYTNAQGLMVDALGKYALGDAYEDVMWFLYEFVPGTNQTIEVTKGNGAITYTINSIDDYLSYFEAEIGA